MTTKYYGLPYIGSKGRTVKEFGNALPDTPVFVDLFAGGCAVSEWMLEHNKCESVMVNDLNDYPQTFKDIATGHLPEFKWISREAYYDYKNRTELELRMFGFSNRVDSYFCSKLFDEYEEGVYEVIYNNDNSLFEKIGFPITSESQLRKNTEDIIEAYLRYKCEKGECAEEDVIKKFRQFTRPITSWRRCEAIGQYDENRIVVSSLDYKMVQSESALYYYADPPYVDSINYYGHNDEWFSQYVEECDKPIIISEYNKRNDEWVEIWASNTNRMFSGSCKERKFEKLFIHKKWLKWYEDIMQKQ